MKKQIGNFKASGDDGYEYEVLIFVKLIDAGSLTDPDTYIHGIKELMTSDGQSVKRLKKGEYEIVGTNVILHSNSPDAP